jgi:hypothetical protein
MFFAKWYRKTVESANPDLYTPEDTQNKEITLLNIVLFITGIVVLGLSLTSIFLYFYIAILVSTASQELPALPCAAAGHALEDVSSLIDNDRLSLAIWMVTGAGLWTGFVESIHWSLFRRVPFNEMEQIVRDY